MRIDQLMVSRGIAGSRSQAGRLIAAGVRWNAGGVWKRASKNGEEVPADADIEVLAPEQLRFVSRGGLKLDAALALTGIAVEGAACLDLGQSTGGFTDCLLQRGARCVLGVDVGSGQLHPRLAADARVMSLEHVNARHLDAAMVRDMVARQGPGLSGAAAPFDLLVGDLSFISQTLVLPSAVPLLRPGADVLMLVKPQFELQPGQIGKRGIVTDARLFAQVEHRVGAAHVAMGLAVQDFFDCAIRGGDGNREFFIHSVKLPERPDALQAA